MIKLKKDDYRLTAGASPDCFLLFAVYALHGEENQISIRRKKRL